jgi:hypothetical protein
VFAILADVPINTTDPLALIIGAGGACIGALSLLVWSLLLARVKQAEKDLREYANHMLGQDGIYPRFTKIEGRLDKTETEIAALKLGTLSREIFDRATREHNEKLEGLREQTKELDHKVDKIDRTLMPPPVPMRPR